MTDAELGLERRVFSTPERAWCRRYLSIALGPYEDLNTLDDPCEHCADTHLDAIPWSELFMEGRKK